LGDHGVRDVLDLCLECRACKAECPVGVDVARFKSEFLADYWKRHGTPLRARLLGNIHSAARWGSRLAPLSNWLVRSGPGRWMAETALGIDARRVPPAWSRPTLRQRVTRRQAGANVQVFVDTFTNYYNPHIGIAGVKVLEAAGLPVTLAPNGCCGRPLISQGLLAEARAAAESNVDALYPLARSGSRFVFFEPSCLSAVREDAPALLRGERQQRAAVIASQSVLFEDLLEQHLAGAASSMALRSRRGRIVLHGHCHQKAMGLLTPAKALLSRIPGAAVEDLDAGCCGMAGSFGYAAEHFDVSRAIGERRLLPAARRLQDGDVLVASGVSCRHQVADFTTARALHPAELLASLVEEPA
jgi:Fe-S oxidoreductase